MEDQTVAYERQVIATLPDGSQVLVWLWASGHIEVNVRQDIADTWRPLSVVGGSVDVIEFRRRV